jgi:hypothetical protein
LTWSRRTRTNSDRVTVVAEAAVVVKAVIVEVEVVEVDVVVKATKEEEAEEADHSWLFFFLLIILHSL